MAAHAYCTGTRNSMMFVAHLVLLIRRATGCFRSLGPSVCTSTASRGAYHRGGAAKGGRCQSPPAAASPATARTGPPEAAPGGVNQAQVKRRESGMSFGLQAPVSHSTATAQPQHSHSTVTAQSQKVNRACHRIASTNTISHSTVTAQSPHRHSTVTAQHSDDRRLKG